LGLVERDLFFYMDGKEQKIKIDHHPLLIAITPLLHHSMVFQTAKTTPLG